MSLVALLLVLLTTGCIVVPRTTTRFDHSCQMLTRQVTLEALPINGVVLNCASTPASCTGVLVVAGVIGSASVVVSGSIAVVGNVMYWLEKQGSCNSGPVGIAPGTDGQTRGSPSPLTVMVLPGGDVVCTRCSTPRKL